MSPKRVLIVEDQFLISEFLRVWIDAAGHQVCAIATTCETAIAYTHAHRPDLILMDNKLEGPLTGVDAAQAILAACPNRIVYCTAGHDEDKLKPLGVGPHECLAKPVDPDALRRLLESD